MRRWSLLRDEYLLEHYPEVNAALEEKGRQALAETGDDLFAARRLLESEWLTQEEAACMKAAELHAELVLRHERRLEAIALLPVWRRPLVRGWDLAARLRGLLAGTVVSSFLCRCGWHVLEPVVESNIVGDVEETGAFVCGLCGRSLP